MWFWHQTPMSGIHIQVEDCTKISPVSCMAWLNLTPVFQWSFDTNAQSVLYGNCQQPIGLELNGAHGSASNARNLSYRDAWLSSYEYVVNKQGIFFRSSHNPHGKAIDPYNCSRFLLYTSFVSKHLIHRNPQYASTHLAYSCAISINVPNQTFPSAIKTIYIMDNRLRNMELWSNLPNASHILLVSRCFYISWSLLTISVFFIFI